MLEIQNLQAGYPGRLVLQEISAHFPAGKVSVVLGPNGCGKSTLIKALCGVLKAKGQALWDGMDLLNLAPKQRARQVACLHQSPPLTDLTAGQLVLCGRYPFQSWPRPYSPSDETAARISMEKLGILSLADRPLSQLSGGQRQKVYLAMAMAQDAPILLLDEPAAYLDVAHQLQLLRIIKDMAAQGKTVIAVLHDLQSALQIADHILRIEEGSIAAEGTPEPVFASGALDRVFGVRVQRISKEGRHLYFCTDQ